MQEYVIKFGSELITTGRWFSSGFFHYKANLHDIAELLLKVALETVNLSLALTQHKQ